MGVKRERTGPLNSQFSFNLCSFPTQKSHLVTKRDHALLFRVNRATPRGNGQPFQSTRLSIRVLLRVEIDDVIFKRRKNRYYMATWKKSYNSFQQMLDDIHADNGVDIDTGHQINEARREAIALVSSAIVGDPEGGEDSPKRDFTIVLEGHANVDRRPVEGQPKDYVSIVVRQK